MQAPVFPAWAPGVGQLSHRCEVKHEFHLGRVEGWVWGVFFFFFFFPFNVWEKILIEILPGDHLSIWLLRIIFRQIGQKAERTKSG
jgi:hypothetical protein